MSPIRVLILGGGYAGCNAVRSMRRAIKRGTLECTVVNRENSQVFHGFIGEMVTGRLSPTHICTPIRKLFAPSALRIAEIVDVDLVLRRATIARELDGARETIEFEQLVIAVGTVDRTDAYPGLAEHAFTLRKYSDCLRLRNHLITMFELAASEQDPAERRRLLTFFIAGGGYAGAEVAGEISDLCTLLTAGEYKTIRREECRVVLVHPGKGILPELRAGAAVDGSHSRLVAYAMQRMSTLGVELMTSTKVAAATASDVLLSNGMRVPTRTIISAVGTKMPALLDRLGLPRDERGRIVTDEYLRVRGYDWIWAAGDCASVALPASGKGSCPPVAIYAMKHGATIGANIVRAATGKKLRRFSFGGIGQGASLGHRSGVGEVKGIEITGFGAWLIWRILLTYYLPSWDRRLRVMIDWFVWPLVGRDTVVVTSE